MKKLIPLAALALLAAGCNNTQTQTPPQNNNSQQNSQTPAPQEEAKTQVYRNGTYGFEFTYPKEMVFNTPSYPNLQDKIVQVAFARGEYPKTNFGDAAFSVSASYAKTQAACLTQGPAKIIFGKDPVRINGADYYKGTDTGAGAGNLYESTIYRTWVGKATCIELNETIHTSNLGNYEPGTVTAVDKTAVQSRLDGILNTFKFDNNQ